LKILLQLDPPCVVRKITFGGGKFFRITETGRRFQVVFNDDYIKQLLGVVGPKYTHNDEPSVRIPDTSVSIMEVSRASKTEKRSNTGIIVPVPYSL
jgi:hypothetical protein